MTVSRRSLFTGAAALAASSSFAKAQNASALAPSATTDAAAVARDEAFWRNVAAQFDVTPDIVNLENGNWGIMSRPVMERYMAHTRMVNRDNSYYSRRQFRTDYLAIRARLAGALGAAESEIALTRGATEALKGLIAGYRGLKPGDAVMYADLDYGSIQACMDWRAAQDECAIVKLTIPEPSDHDGLIAFYREALEKNPSTKLLLLTHISHRTGLAIPVRDITEIARAMGADVVVDAAHSWGQMDFTVGDLGADFVGFNMHKWIGAPLGVGAVYIKENRIDDIAPDPAAGAWERDLTTGRIHTGTFNYAAFLTIPDALDFHETVGPAAKEARLRYLRELWVKKARKIDALDILTPEDARLHAGITSFRFKGKTSLDDNKEIAQRLLEDYKVYTVHRTGVAAGACVRVTPSIYNSEADMARLAQALQDISLNL